MTGWPNLKVTDEDRTGIGQVRTNSEGRDQWSTIETGGQTRICAYLTGRCSADVVHITVDRGKVLVIVDLRIADVPTNAPATTLPEQFQTIGKKLVLSLKSLGVTHWPDRKADTVVGRIDSDNAVINQHGIAERVAKWQPARSETYLVIDHPAA